MNDLKGNDVAWIFVGGPAVLGWLAYLLCWLLAPRLAATISHDPIIWAGYAVGAWYFLIMIVTCGPWSFFLLI